MAPATAPKQYGTSTEETAKAAPKLRRSRVRNTVLRKAKLDPRSTMPKSGERQRHEQRQGDRREGLGEPRPQHDEAEDQPDVIGLPHRSDRVVDHLPGALAGGWTPGDEIPEAGAEVGAAEDGVGGDAGEQQGGDGLSHQTATSSCSGASASGSRGP